MLVACRYFKSADLLAAAHKRASLTQGPKSDCPTPREPRVSSIGFLRRGRAKGDNEAPSLPIRSLGISPIRVSEGTPEEVGVLMQLQLHKSPPNFQHDSFWPRNACVM